MTNGLGSLTDTSRIESLVNPSMLLTAGPCSDTHSLSCSVFLSLSPALSHQLIDLSAASNVDRMYVMRDQDSVSAMWTAVKTSITMYCEFITCLRLETRDAHAQNFAHNVANLWWKSLSCGGPNPVYFMIWTLIFSHASGKMATLLCWATTLIWFWLNCRKNYWKEFEIFYTQ